MMSNQTTPTVFAGPAATDAGADVLADAFRLAAAWLVPDAQSVAR